MALKETTIARIGKIFSSPLLQNCGKIYEGKDASRIRAVDHCDFLKSIQSDYWENTLRRSFNIISDAIIANHSYRYFSDTISVLQETLGNIIKPKITVLLDNSDYCLDESVKNEVRRTLIFIVRNHCYENEFFELIKQRNTNVMIDVLCSGHLPCGYEGVYPDGTALIY